MKWLVYRLPCSEKYFSEYIWSPVTFAGKKTTAHRILVQRFHSHRSTIIPHQVAYYQSVLRTPYPTIINFTNAGSQPTAVQPVVPIFSPSADFQKTTRRNKPYHQFYPRSHSHSISIFLFFLKKKMETGNLCRNHKTRSSPIQYLQQSPTRATPLYETTHYFTNTSNTRLAISAQVPIFVRGHEQFSPGSF